MISKRSTAIFCLVVFVVPVTFPPTNGFSMILDALKYSYSKGMEGVGQVVGGLQAPIARGAAILGDVIPALYSFQCISALNNFTNFMLFSRVHPDDPRPLVPNNWKLLQKSEFDQSLQTKLIIHGFVDNMRLSDWMVKMKNALLREGDYNVIIVDWSCGNGFPYAQAIRNARITADKVTELLTFLQSAKGSHPTDFHIIGHSLGSQIAAIVGNRIPHLGRISGLDPAGPRFYNTAPEYKLDPSDAEFVDVIHTDGGASLLEGLGLHEQVGHVDFYPNGGRTQPGCHSSPLSILPRIGIQRAARYYLTCDHFRAIDYYIESIGAKKVRDADTHCQYVGVQCRDWKTFTSGECADCGDPENCATMGFYSDKLIFRNPHEGPREFYLATSEVEPFCVHQYQVVFEMGPGGGGFAVRTDALNSVNEPKIDNIHLEVKTGSGKISKLVLRDKKNEVMSPSNKHVFLATSKYPLGEVQEANIWWGSEEKPTLDATEDSLSFGFSLKSVEIVPIAIQPEAKARKLKLKRSVLCGNEKKVLSKDHYLSVSNGKC